MAVRIVDGPVRSVGLGLEDTQIPGHLASKNVVAIVLHTPRKKAAALSFLEIKCAAFPCKASKVTRAPVTQ